MRMGRLRNGFRRTGHAVALQPPRRAQQQSLGPRGADQLHAARMAPARTTGAATTGRPMQLIGWV